MARPPTGSNGEEPRGYGRGQVIERNGRFAIRYYCGGKRVLHTLGVKTREQAEEKLDYRLKQIENGDWKEPEKSQPKAEIDPQQETTFHKFASEWYSAREAERLAPRTLEDFRWALSNHLLPFFKDHRLDQITPAEVDRYKNGKAAERTRIDAERERAARKGERYLERGLSHRSINHTLGVLAGVLEQAVDYGVVTTNAATGKRRRLKAERPRRLWAGPEQLMALLEAAEKPRKLLGGRGRPLLATLAGAGLRIDEALSLQRQHVNTAKGTLTIVRSKTDAGVRVVDIPPALRDELATYLDESVPKEPTALVFGTSTGGKENPSNVRQRLFVNAIEEANKRLAKLGIEPLGDVRPHGLRRTYASLRTACGDDPVFVSQQIGHEDVRFTLNVYAQSVKRRERMTKAERHEYDRAVEWAQWAQLGTSDLEKVMALSREETKNPA
jgi:integrase